MSTQNISPQSSQQKYLHLHALTLFTLSLILTILIIPASRSHSYLSLCINLSRLSQLIALSEIYQAYARLIKSSIPIQIAQNLGRCFVIFCAVSQADAFSHFRHIAVWMLLFAWGLGDVIRYAFYVFKGSKVAEMLRFNGFIVLYPLGMISEVLCVINAWWYHERMAFWMKLFMVIVTVAYPTLYMYMLKQRAKRNKRMKPEAR